MKLQIEIVEYKGVKVAIYKSDIDYTDKVVFDINADLIRPGKDIDKLPQSYISFYIFNILARSSDVQSDLLVDKLFNLSIQLYDLSSYEVGRTYDINVDEDGNIIQDTELEESKSTLISIINNPDITTNDELIKAIKDNFNLTEVNSGDDTEVVSDEGRGSGYVRPSTLSEFSNLISSYLTSESYIKGNYVEFTIPNPITDFIVNGSDTQLMTQIREFYSQWKSIEVEEVTKNQIIITNAYPLADPNLYIKVGDRYLRTLPEDIEVTATGDSDWIDLFQSGPDVNRLVVMIDNENYVDLSIDKIRLINYNGELVPWSNVKYRSKASGEVGTNIYAKVNDSYLPIDNLASNLYMVNRIINNTSSTKFRFKFK